METRKVLEYALAREREGLRFFGEQAERPHHSSVTDVFRRLVAEEEGHIKFIQQLLADLDADRPLTAATVAACQLVQHDTSFFEERAESEQIDQTVAESMVPDLPVLRMAFLIERDLAEFYRSSAEGCDESAREALLMLAGWEAGHERLFRNLHDALNRKYGQLPWGG